MGSGTSALWHLHTQNLASLGVLQIFLENTFLGYTYPVHNIKHISYTCHFEIYRALSSRYLNIMELEKITPY